MGFVTIAADACTLVCRVRQYVISATAVSGDDDSCEREYELSRCLLIIDTLHFRHENN